MTNPSNEQWLVCGWPLTNRGEIESEISANLYESSDTSGYTRSHPTVPVEIIGLESVAECELSPGVFALHEVSPDDRAVVLDYILADDPKRQTTDNPFHLISAHKSHNSWVYGEFVNKIARIQRAARRSCMHPESRSVTNAEIAREIAYRVATYFGFDVLRDATHSYQVTIDQNSDLFYQIDFESPVKTPSLLDTTIKLGKDGVIDLTLRYRFSPRNSWHEFVSGCIDGFEGFYLHALLKALIVELLTLAEHDLTYDEAISYLGTVHDITLKSDWAQFEIDESEAIEFQPKSSRPKLEEMFFE